MAVTPRRWICQRFSLGSRGWAGGGGERVEPLAEEEAVKKNTLYDLKACKSEMYYSTQKQFQFQHCGKGWGWVAVFIKCK